MSFTINRLMREGKGKHRIKKSKTRLVALDKCPQKKGKCFRVYTVSPRKPNSARRKVARVCLSNLKMVTAYIPGEGHNLARFSDVLVRGGSIPDLPGVKYRVIRNKYDCAGVVNRISSRSKYGKKLDLTAKVSKKHG